MPSVAARQDTFIQDGSKASFINVVDGQSITIYSNGDTLYYDNASTVSSTSNDGSIATGASATFTTPQYVVCATGDTTQVTILADESYPDLEIGDDLTITGTTTLTGGVSAVGPDYVSTVPLGSVAFASLGTEVAPVAKTEYFASVFVPVNKTITGAGMLWGTIGGTDKVVYYLHNNAGTPVAQSAAAGTTSGDSNTFQEIDFTATYDAVGPARYWLGVQSNGTTDKLRFTAAATGPVPFNGTKALAAFGTAETITTPTDATADEGPIAYLY